MRRRTERQAGFTLIELMVVVLVIAILLAIAIPTFLGARTRSQDTVAKAALRTALTAASTSFVDTVSFVTADATGLAAEEPSLSYVSAVTPSIGPKSISISASANSWAAAALSGSGTCWMIATTSSGTVTYGASIAACTGTNAVTMATASAWGIAPSSPTYWSTVLADSPAAYWHLTETSGTTAADSGPAGAAATWQGGGSAAAGVTGPLTGYGAAGTVSSPPYLVASAANGGLLDLRTSVTVEAWIKPDVAGENAGIIEKTVGTAVNTQFLLFLEGGQLVWRTLPSAGGWGHVYTGYFPPTGTWTHVAGTFDGTTVRAYANGVQVGASVSVPSPLLGGAGNVYLGHLGTGIYAFTGSIAEAAVYPTALSAARIAAHYAARS
jgi:prepilin-type N-terminal cleavage/methylation domain-containing protein